MAEIRWAVVPACLTFGPLFLVMGIGSDGWLLLGGLLMTTTGLGILFHGVITRQLPKPWLKPYFDRNLSDIVLGVGFGCLIVSGFFRYLSEESLMYVGFSIVIAGDLFLKPWSIKRKPHDTV